MTIHTLSASDWDMTVAAVLSNILHTARKAARLTRPDVASALDVSLDTVAAFESGAELPSPQRLAAVAELYGTTPSALADATIARFASAGVQLDTTTVDLAKLSRSTDPALSHPRSWAQLCLTLHLYRAEKIVHAQLDTNIVRDLLHVRTTPSHAQGRRTVLDNPHRRATVRDALTEFPDLMLGAAVSTVGCTRRTTTDALVGRYRTAGDVDGQRRLHDTGYLVAVPWQLTPPPAEFSHRMTELAQLDTARSTVIQLTGDAGIGKSALARRWIHQQTETGRFADGHLHAELTGPSGQPVSPTEVLDRFLRALGVAGHDIPDTTTERAVLYRTLTAGRAVAVLLDDAMTADQISYLVPSSSASRVIVTSRRPLIGLHAATVIRVRPLDENSSSDLLRQYLGPDAGATEQDIARLAPSLGGSPLALRIAAGLVTSGACSGLAWIDAHLRNVTSPVFVDVSVPSAVRAVLDVAYQALPPPAADVYQYVGRTPGTVCCADLLAVALDTSADAARDAIDVLTRAGLLTAVGEGHVRLRPVVGTHAFAVAQPWRSPSTRKDDWLRAMRWRVSAVHVATRAVLPHLPLITEPDHRGDRFLLPHGLTDREVALRWLDTYRNQMLRWAEAAEQKEQWHAALQFADALHAVYLYFHDYRAAADIHTLGVRATHALRAPDIEFQMRKRRARTLIRLGHLGPADTEIERMRESAIGHDLRSAGLHRTRGMLHVAAGLLTEASACFGDAWNMVRDLHQPRTEGVILTHLAAVMADLGEPVAIEHAERATSLLTRLPVPDEIGVARARLVLALIHIHNGPQSSAVAELRSAMTALAACGSAADIARGHDAVAELRTAEGDHMAAAVHRDTAHALRTGGAVATRWTP
ncbi:helix-turn-helix domain-containing protein [Kibdelosporangium phytohabitans]|uniref:HTH cro/C1-type domain-containing protein n=1 Tax=Kibdelosporangium phytohabitans TaxID=860235 RepID=A0A0N7F2P6_9PSEU|nr:helix-turn-helix domain-containing protein [Kibdelosporangium phytohabitans]ALG06415.1 hypothetical protein AOZ06_05275 [Kibdelosporangium phytohabitans]MBE1467570.1 transcriptional regulator with XRE-family HTH domain [Kibdelosporangium phytohabitans]